LRNLSNSQEVGPQKELLLRLK